MSAPTSTRTDGTPDETVEAKRERLKSLLRRGGDTAPGPGPATTAPERPEQPSEIPLTPEQRGLLFLHRLDPGTGLYDIPVAVELRGPLDVPRLSRAFDALTARHPVLATRVAARPDGPVLVAAPAPPRLEVREAAGGADAPPESYRAAPAREAARPLDPERGLLRAVLFAHAPDHHHLLLVVHHLVFDGHSSVVVLRDLWALYRAPDDPGAPGPAGPSFADYAALRAERAAQDQERLTGFWRERMSGVTGAPLLPFDRPGTTRRTRASASVPVRFGTGETAALRSFAARSRSSVFAVLLAAYLLALGRHDPGRRLAVGTPVAIRHDARFDRTVGYLTNLIPVRSPLPAGDDGGTTTAAGYVRAVRAELTAGLDHCDLPFPRIAELLDDGFDPEDGSPFTCPFAFLHEQADPAGDIAPGLTAAIVEEIQQPGVGHVNLTLVERDGEIRGLLKYDRERFDRPSAERCAAEVAAVAGALAAAPDAPVAEVLGRALREAPGAARPLGAASVTGTAAPARASGGAGQDRSGSGVPAPVDARALAACREAWAALLPGLSTDEGGEGADAGPDGPNFFAAGGDSILAVQLVTRLRGAGFSLSARDVFRDPTPGALARLLTGRASAPPPPDDGGDAPAPVPPRTGAAPAVPGPSPVQSWFFERVAGPERRHWNLSAAVRLRQPADPLLVRLALQCVLAAHPALTCRIAIAGADHRVRPAPAPSGRAVRDLLTVVDAGGDDGEAERRWQDVQRGLDPEAGRVFGALLVRGATASPDSGEACSGDAESDEPACEDILRLTAHHLVMDAVSWGIVLSDLDTALGALREGELPRLPPEPTGERAWAALLARAAADPEGAAYWRAVAEARHECDGLLASLPPGREEEGRHEEFVLAADPTKLLLTDVPRRLGLPVHTVLTGAVALALARWRGCRLVTLDVETHGRLDSAAGPGPRACAGADLSRTVGWLTSVDPVVVSGPRQAGAEEFLREAAGALAAPAGHAGFLAYRHLSPDADLREELAAVPPALVSFNYLGQTDRLAVSDRFAPAAPPPGDRSPRARRPYPVEVYAVVRDGRLRVGVVWSPAAADGLDAGSVRSLSTQVRAALTELAGPGGGTADGTGTSGAVSWPLTPQQYGVVAEALAAAAGRHVEQFHWWWRGAFDRERFARAWRVLTRRHIVLRARVADGTPPCLTAPPEDRPPLTWLTADGPDSTPWEEVVRAERDRGFGTAGEPLLRVTVRREADGHRVLLTFHHALLDGWSVALLLGQLYEAYLDGTDPAAARPRRPDARDHAAWVAGRDEDRARAYWSERLAGPRAAVLPGVLRPVTAPAAPAPAAEVRTELPGDAADALRVWAARHAATESNVLQAVWAALLWRCAGGGGTGRARLGVTLSGRANGPDGVRGIPGMLATTLPLDLAVDPDDRVADLVERAREATLDLQDFEWVSTGQIHGWAGLPGREPLFDSLLVVENYPASLGDVGERLAAAGCEVEVPTATGARTGYAVTAVVHRAAGALVTVFVPDPGRVEKGDADRLAELWDRSLRRLADDPDGLTVRDLVGRIGDEDLPGIAPRGTGGVLARPADRPVAWPPSARDAGLVRDAFREVLGVGEVAPGDHFYELGGHSLLSVRLLRALADLGAPPLTLGDLVRHPVAGELAAFLAGRRAGDVRGDGPPEAPDAPDAVDPLVPLREPGPDADGTPVTVYLVHPPGGQVACYGALAAHFPGPARLVGVQDVRTVLTGEPPARTVEELARAYARAVPPPAPGERVVLGGFSGGGVIAYELARALRAEGRAPDLVVMLDAAAPTGQRTDTTADGSFLRQVEAYERTRAGAASRAPGSGGPDAAELAPDEYLDELASVADWMGTTGADPFALLRETLGAVESYRPGPYPGPLLVLRAAETDFGRGSAFDASDTYYARPAMGWAEHCPLVTVEEIPGNHISLLSHRHAPALGELLAARVAGREETA
ncbi:condensation domain-containing protein [Streptomyces griseoviridis]|uniref:Carrier domain-containing protein n=1 Tax=Streptomyces griseoviridis TaxID=45398 RepID=A0A918GEQ1_STRGD|nr:condensation domain-containing protein [Streptomyces niveoruber]GGS31255.1 hypothetical protein GCM10010238_20380 [Streptomyces niveoruber]